jgi:RNase adaptor protein for sRNA GlmZ degradation
MSKKIVQFGFKHVSPASMNWGPVIDCRDLPNPYRYGVPDESLKQKVRKADGFLPKVREVVVALDEHDVVYVGCYGGKHRSAAVAEQAALMTGAEIERV